MRILRALERSDAPLTLTEIARRLGLSVSTCQAILATLDASGLVVRSPQTRAYTLGPALIVLGDAARGSSPLLARACAILDDLEAATGYGCTLLMLGNDELTVACRSTRLRDLPVPAMAEGPFPFVAPFGAAIVATGSADVQRAWLATLGGVRGDVARYRALLETIRRNRWCAWSYSGATKALFPEFETVLHRLSRDTEGSAAAQQVLQLLALADSRGYLAAELARARSLSVTMVTVPARLVSSELEIHLYLYENGIGRRRLREVAGLAVDAADAIGALPGAAT